MNKTVKGAIAAGSAALLLAGGAGSLAYWESSSSVSAGSISSGKLALTPAAGNGTWKTSGGSAISNIASYKIVPGESITYTKNFTVTASGTNLKADVAIDKSSITGELLNNGGATVSTRVLRNNNPVTAITSQDDNQTLAAEVTVSFPQSVSGSDFQNKSMDLSSIAVKATQTAPGTTGN